jgi:hypothetical protein
MDTSRHSRRFTSYCSIRAATISVAFAIVSVVSPAAMLAHETAVTPVTDNQRSIALVESKEPPRGIPAGTPAPPVRVPYDESEHAAARNRGGIALTGAQTANERSIALVESKGTAHVPALTTVPQTSDLRNCPC